MFMPKIHAFHLRTIAPDGEARTL